MTGTALGSTGSLSEMTAQQIYDNFHNAVGTAASRKPTNRHVETCATLTPRTAMGDSSEPVAMDDPLPLCSP
ncbi:hypothetical protein [Amycolatopsis viridis]|uniref:Uncharacterized protein n=1 Tax=Amycolatopsis viridis TaxID=185678 RepID=A0ABX0SN24_9PSEU|nr:hypothetical protein [Amycolatopsis viridis]NIH78378.1 hypothetical protein [Amycolatopsis viridis]